MRRIIGPACAFLNEVEQRSVLDPLFASLEIIRLWLGFWSTRTRLHSGGRLERPPSSRALFSAIVSH